MMEVTFSSKRQRCLPPPLIEPGRALLLYLERPGSLRPDVFAISLDQPWLDRGNRGRPVRNVLTEFLSPA